MISLEIIEQEVGFEYFKSNLDVTKNKETSLGVNNSMQPDTNKIVLIERPQPNTNTIINI